MRKCPFLSITLLSWTEEFSPPSLPSSFLSSPFCHIYIQPPSLPQYRLSHQPPLCSQETSAYLITALSPGIIIASHCLSPPASLSSYPCPGPGPGRLRACGEPSSSICFLHRWARLWAWCWERRSGARSLITAFRLQDCVHGDNPGSSRAGPVQ